MFINFFNKL